MKRILFCIIILFSSGVSYAQPDIEKLDAYFDTLNRNNKFLGSVALLKNGNILYQSQHGIAGKDMELNQNTAYRIGSITKMFTAVMILQLMEEKRLSLEDKLSVFFPKIKNADRITIRQMLNHSSGIHNFTDDTTYWQNVSEEHKRPEILDQFYKLPSDFEPGSQNQYSNTNYVLLGYIVEQAGKRPYQMAVQERICKKLHLQHTYLGKEIRPYANEVPSYEWNGGEWQGATETNMSIPGGAGAMVGNPTELCMFIEALFHGKLISPKSLNLMTEVQDHYGLGIFDYPFQEKQGYGHSGGIDGFRSFVIYFPGDSLAMALTSNGMNFRQNDIHKTLLSAYFNDKIEMPDVRQEIQLPGETLLKYLGNYKNSDLPMSIKIFLKDGLLNGQAQGQPSFPLSALSETEFVYVPAGVKIIFKTEANRCTGITLLQNGIEIPFKKDE